MGEYPSTEDEREYQEEKESTGIAKERFFFGCNGTHPFTLRKGSS
jgi:hypothetical protein